MKGGSQEMTRIRREGKTGKINNEELIEWGTIEEARVVDPVA